MLAPSFGDRAADITEENLQCRVRGSSLMALSNKFGWLVLTTGNKSEMAVGYSTLYGDTAGGFAVIKDVLEDRSSTGCAAHRNADRRDAGDPRRRAHEAAVGRAAARPARRPEPAAVRGARPVLEAYVEDDLTAAELIEPGFDEAIVRRITRLVDLAEYKRRQSPPGVRVTPKAFGKDRRLPITNAYRG